MINKNILKLKIEEKLVLNNYMEYETYFLIKNRKKYYKILSNKYTSLWTKLAENLGYKWWKKQNNINEKEFNNIINKMLNLTIEILILERFNYLEVENPVENIKNYFLFDKIFNYSYKEKPYNLLKDLHITMDIKNRLEILLRLNDYKYQYKDLLENCLFNIMLKKQFSLNDNTFSEWKTKLTFFHWLTAINVEVEEAKESLKLINNKKLDIENLKVELIDILHFVLSGYYYLNPKEKFNILKDFFNYKIKKNNSLSTIRTYEVINERKILKLLNKMQTTKEADKLFNNLLKLFKLLNMDKKEIFIRYITKNILNLFRQKYGYKEGNYIKFWKKETPIGNIEVEDNVIALELANKIEFNPKSFELDLYNDIEYYYNNNVLNKNI